MNGLMMSSDTKEVKVVECEVYSRVVGYYRPVQNWNTGKKYEFTERHLINQEKYDKNAEVKMKRLRIGIHGPLIMGAQVQLGFEEKDCDGFHGPQTNRALIKYQKNNGLEVTEIFDKKTLRKLKIPLQYRVFNIISEFEGANSKTNAWGYKILIDDGAGWNYGILQHNRLGSLQTIRKKFRFTNPPGRWFGSPAGAKGQYWYFMKYIYNPSVKNAELIGDTSERVICMLCDSKTQGGSFYPGSAPKSYKDWKLDENLISRSKKLFNDHSRKAAFLSMIIGYEKPGTMYAELRPRSGNVRWLDDQLSRRRAVIYGNGTVHGSIINMEYFLL